MFKKRKVSKKRSYIWSHFIEIEVNKTAQCKFCSQILSFKGGSIFNLSRHFKNKHIHEYTSAIKIEEVNKVESDNEDAVELQAEMFDTLSNMPSASTSQQYEDDDASTSSTNAPTLKFSIQQQPVSEIPIMQYFHNNPTANQDQLNQLLVQMVVKNYVPFEIVESGSFKRFLSALNPDYQVPSRKILSEVLMPQMFNMQKEAIFDTLKSCKSVCLALDSWASVMNESYISVTAHTIDNEDQHCTFLLECYNYTDNPTSANLANELTRIVECWQIEQKIEAIVTNKAPKIIGAVKKTKWNHVLCLAHTINLVMQNAMVCIRDIHIKVKRIVDYFKRSPKAIALLKSMLKQMGEPDLNLEQDGNTHWNSTFDMFKSILETKDALISTIAIHYPNLNNLTYEDIHVLEKSCEILDVFKDVADEISNEKRVTASKIILLTSGLKKYSRDFLEINQDLPNVVKELAQSVLTSLNEEFSDTERNQIFAQSTFLDPRFKRYGFTNDTYFETATNEITQILQNYFSETLLAVHKNSDGNRLPEDSKRVSKIWRDFDLNVSNLIEDFNPKVSSSIEINKYLQEPILLRTADPLLWWRERKNIYPRLYDMAMKKLCIVATSVPSERIYSRTGQIITERRTRLTDDNVMQIEFLNVNL